MNKKIIIGSRGSKLALLYAQQAKDKIIENTKLSNDEILIKSITTKGDEVRDIRLSEVGGKGLFCSNIEKELQLKNIDIAVHALKDMPADETNGLRASSNSDCEIKELFIIALSHFKKSSMLKKTEPSPDTPSIQE